MPFDFKKINLKPVILVGKGVHGIFRLIGTAIMTVIMVGIITGCIVGCVLTVYVLNAIGAEEEISLEQIQLGYTSTINAVDKETGEKIPLQRLYKTDNNRIWIDLAEIPDHTWQAMIAIEDKRFLSHEGVDWIRTTGSFINLLMPLTHTTSGGGSTIHQQLIKNVTGDNGYRVDRKVREIFRALNLAQNYTRDQVLETYLNVVPFGAGTNGIQSAANTYFGKTAQELTLAESAAIVGITQYPGYYNPFVHPDNNKERQEYVLLEMFKQGFITEDEYDGAVKQRLSFKRQEHLESVTGTQSWFVDAVEEQVIEHLVEKKGMEYADAETMLYEGGLEIDATIDLDIQAHLDEVYSTSENFPSIHNEEYPESAAVITDPNGQVLALVGGIGDKPGSRIFNRATMAKRQPGSSIKPIGVYSTAFEYDQIYWSTLVDDYPINPDEPMTQWYPQNYYGGYLRMVTIDMAMRRSINTVAVKMAEKMSPRTVFDFLHDDLHMDSLTERTVSSDGEVFSDINIAPMALGGLTEGVAPLEMAGAYQIFGNGGFYTEPYLYTEVRDADGRVILKADTQPRRVLSPDTADLMNKLLYNVCNATSGTGAAARVANMPTAGKTGTSNDDVDQWFIGYTPYYVCQVWMGYDEPWTYDSAGNRVQNRIDYYTGGHRYPPPVLFKSIMDPIHEGLEYKDFEQSGLLVQEEYCTATGKLAGENCQNRALGWYKDKPTGKPQICNGRHMTPEELEAAESGQVDPDDPNAGYDGQGPPPSVGPAVPVSGGANTVSQDDPNAGYDGQGPPPM